MYSRVYSRLPLQHVRQIIQQSSCHHLNLFNVIRRKVAFPSTQFAIGRSQQLRLYSSDNDVHPQLEAESFEETISEESADFSFKNILYLETDPTLRQINECSSPKELFDLFEKHGSSFQPSHLVQTVILLWDFRRKESHGNASLHENIMQHQAFPSLAERLFDSVHQLNINERSCCYLYLRRIGLNSRHKLLQTLLFNMLEAIDKGQYIPLTALSRLLIAIKIDRDLSNVVIGRNIIPHILKSLQSCKTSEDIRLITICLSSLRHIVTVDILNIYKSKVQELLKLRAITPNSTRCVAKVLNFLNYPIWFHRNSALVRKLILLLLPDVDKLSENEIRTIFNGFQSQLEPAAIAPKLLNVSERIMNEHLTPEMLACAVYFVKPKQREHLVVLFKKLLTDDSVWQQSNAASYFFTILRTLKVSDSALCDEYWTRILNMLKENSESEHFIFWKHCHRYMYFNNNLGGTYRHIAFEKYLTQLCMNEITAENPAISPSRFATIAPFVIAYGHTYRSNVKLPGIIVSKIEAMASQLDIGDCLQLSRGIQIALEMRFRHFIPNALADQLKIIEDILSKCSQRHLDHLERGDVNSLNAIVRGLINRKCSKKSPVFQQALKKYHDVVSTNLNSRLLRNMSFNLSTSNFVAPSIIEKMFKYLVKNEKYVTGDTTEKILSCSYNLGYSPQLLDGLESSAKIVLRDFDYMTGLSIIQACLSLCFFKALPEKLINKVFSEEFIKRIEEEIMACYSKATYPERVLNYVMQLNRAVCLDFPEADVPWFQQNYLEAHLSKHPFVKSKYNEDVKEMLQSIFKNESLFRCNHVTPYGYRIDFVIHFDKQNQAVAAPTETAVLDKITKVAILLLKLDSLCINDLNVLRGKEALKMRHLEMLGYKVVHINEADWNSFQIESAKANYLKCMLQISS